MKKSKKASIWLLATMIFISVISPQVAATNEAAQLMESSAEKLNGTVNSPGVKVADIGIETPVLEVTYKSLDPMEIKQGENGVLNLTISEIRGWDWAKDTNITVEILKSEGCFFLESDNNLTSEYLGRINPHTNKSTAFNLSVMKNASFGYRTIKITIKYWETDFFDLITLGPYYKYAYLNFTVLTVDEEIVDEGNTTIPCMVYMILHDPNGDGSYSYIEESEKFTIGSEFDLRTSKSTKVEAALDYFGNGIGFMNQVNLSNTTSGGVEINFETTQKIETPKSEKSGAMGPGYGDVFIGEKWDIYYQFINRTAWRGNETDPHYQLVNYELVYRYWIVRSSEFTKTGSWINENIEEPWRSRILALDMGFDNRIDNDEVNKTELKETRLFTAGPAITDSNSTILTKSTSYTFTMEVNETVAINWGLDIIDIPFGGKVTIASSLYMGQTNYTNQEQKVESGYVLTDNDVEPVTDELNLSIYYDKVYGTFLFTTNTDDSYTSEPREPWTKSHVNITPTSGKAGTHFSISAKMCSKSLNKVEAIIEHPDKTAIINLTLYDDGAHGDGAASDGYYGNTWDSSGAEEGLYYIDIVSWNEVYHREEAENLAIFSINTTRPAPPNISWIATFEATNQLESLIIGMHPNATDGYDGTFDIYAQTPVQGTVILTLDELYSRSIKETRCYNEVAYWNISIGVPSGQTTVLSWSVPQNVTIMVFNATDSLESGSQLGEGNHNFIIAAKIPEGQNHTLNLNPGWNMVSLPVIPKNNSIQAIFGSIPTLDTMPIVKWKAPSFVEVAEAEPMIGYWIFTPTAATICLTGVSVTDTTLNLKAGWNMVGTLGRENLSIAEIPNQVPLCPAVTWESPSFVETDVIEPGKAAWVFVTKDTVGAASEGSPKGMEMASASTAKSSAIQTSSEEWNLTISATNQLEPVTFGIDPSATDGYDAGYDVFTQTPVQGKVTLILDGIYAREINKNRMIWILTVGVPSGETTILSWNLSQIPSDISLILDDGIDMKMQNSAYLDEGSYLFEIVGAPVGDEEPPAAPTISSATHPNENLIYCNIGPVFSWTTPSDLSGIACYSYLLDHFASTTPDETCDTTGTTKSYTNLSFDTWYFHVRAKDNANNWGPAAHFKVQIENCDTNDGCYAYGTGCEDRDYYCNGTSCTYSYSNRHVDAYDGWIYYCSGDTVRKHRLFHDFYCNGGSCVDHTIWVDDQLVENCNSNDGWVDTGTTRWVDDPTNQSKEKEQKEQEYHDYTCSNGGCVFAVTTTQWIDTGNKRDKPTEGFFDTGISANPYPSISGRHNGTIQANETITVRKLYTYPCVGTAGHSEYIAISYPNGTVLAKAQWNGYIGDWHNLTFNSSFTLYANETYNYTIVTGSYPQIIHESEYNATGGVITCTSFVDINGKQHEGWIPAIRLEGEGTTDADGAVSVVRDLPDAVSPDEQFNVSLTQSGFLLHTGIVTETLPAGFTYVLGSLRSDIAEYDEATKNLTIYFKGVTSITYLVEAGTAEQIENAAFSGIWKTADIQLNKLSGEVEGDTGLALAVIPSPTPDNGG